jgi:threonine synthase
VTFEEALLAGLAPDGGLYVPDAVPRPEDPAALRGVGFPVLARRLLHAWLGGEVEEATLGRLVDGALNFPLELVPLQGTAWEGVYVLELFHGPTLSFKDFGARTMAALMGHFLARRGETLTILVATSGDTGSAVADGFGGLPNLEVVLLYPGGQVSPTQERQLVVRRPGVRAFAVEGTFDDCQRMVKAAFVDPMLAGRGLSSANSINIGRLLPQTLYYWWAGGRDGQAAEAAFCVPSGNLGNLTGGVLAARGGLPVRRFIAAHNANDFCPGFLEGRDVRFGPSRRTLSNAMDVGAPSNFERLRVLLPDAALQALLWGTSVDDATTRTALRRVYEEAGYLADPHTAVGLEAVRRYRAASGDHGPVIVLSTAHPAKFPDLIEDVLGRRPGMPEQLAALRDQETQVSPLEPTPEALRKHLL